MAINKASVVSYVFTKTSTGVRIVLKGQESGNSLALIVLQADIRVNGVKSTDVYFPYNKPGFVFTEDEMKTWCIDNGYDLDRGESSANEIQDDEVYSS